MAYGLAFLWIGQFLINIGVNVGLLPTKGLTLPFLSYGGSSLVICCACLGMLMRIEWNGEPTWVARNMSSTKRTLPMKGNVLIMAGGTGGLRVPGARLCAGVPGARLCRALAGDATCGIENDLVPKAGLPLHLIQVSGLRGKGLKSLVKAPLELLSRCSRRCG